MSPGGDPSVFAAWTRVRWVNACGKLPIRALVLHVVLLAEEPDVVARGQQALEQAARVAGAPVHGEGGGSRPIANRRAR
jgi:hypothetical protein